MQEKTDAVAPREGGAMPATQPHRLAHANGGSGLDPLWIGAFRPVPRPEALDLVLDAMHHLRSPSMSITMLADALLRSLAGTVTPAQRRQLALIYGASLSLSLAASDAIELAHGDNKPAAYDAESFSIATMFESVRRILAPMAEERGLEIRTVSSTADHRVGPRVALDRVLLNLATNALRSAVTGFVELAATTIADHRVVLTVRDTGPGLSPAAIEALYRPSARPRDRRADAPPESWFSFAACRKLLLGMQSELQVETRIGWGTRMRFELDLPEARFEPTP